MSVQLVTGKGSIRDQVSAEEWQARVELAAGHRVLAYYGAAKSMALLTWALATGIS